MVWKKQPKMDEKVYVGTCPVCQKVRIHKIAEGKVIYCPECEVFNYNSTLIPFSVATSIDAKQKDKS